MDVALIGAIVSIVGGLVGFYIGWTLTKPKPEEVKKFLKKGKKQKGG